MPHNSNQFSQFIAGNDDKFNLKKPADIGRRTNVKRLGATTDVAALPPSRDLLESLSARTRPRGATPATDIAESVSRGVSTVGRATLTDPLGFALEGVTALGAGGGEYASVDVPRLAELQRAYAKEQGGFFQRTFPQTALAARAFGAGGGLEVLEPYAQLTPTQLSGITGTLPPSATRAPTAEFLPAETGPFAGVPIQQVARQGFDPYAITDIQTRAPEGFDLGEITSAIRTPTGFGAITFEEEARRRARGETAAPGGLPGAGTLNVIPGLSRIDRQRAKALFIRDKQFSSALQLAETPQEQQQILRAQERSKLERALTSKGLSRARRIDLTRRVKRLDALELSEATTVSKAAPKFADLLKARTAGRGQDITLQKDAFRSYAQNFLDPEGQPLPGAPDFGEFTRAYISGDQEALSQISTQYTITRQLSAFNPEDIAEVRAAVSAKGGSDRDVLQTLIASGK